MWYIHIYIYFKEALKKYSHFYFKFVIIDFLVTPTHLIIQCQIVTFRHSVRKKNYKIMHTCTIGTYNTISLPGNKKKINK